MFCYKWYSSCKNLDTEPDVLGFTPFYTVRHGAVFTPVPTLLRGFYCEVLFDIYEIFFFF